MDDALAFVEQKDYEKGFAAYFDKEIKPYLADLETRRLAALAVVERRMRIAKPIALAIIFSLAGLALFAGAFGALAPRFVPPEFVMYGMIFAFGACFGLFVWVFAGTSKFQSLEKTELLPKVAGFFGAFTYIANPKITYELISQTRIIPGGEAGVSAEDGLSGTYEGTRVDFCQLTTRSQGSKNSYVEFKRFFVAIALAKKFNGVTVVKTAGGLLGSAPESVADLQKVQLEDPDFSRRFEVFSTDQVEARVLLAPDIMERFKELSDLHDRGGINFAFMNQTLYIAIATSAQLFPAADISVSVYSEAEIHAFLARLHAILGIIDLLKLNR